MRMVSGGDVIRGWSAGDRRYMAGRSPIRKTQVLYHQVEGFLAFHEEQRVV